jgi:hypothetical protein
VQSGLSLVIRFLLVKLTHSDLNSIFDMSVIFMTNYSLSRDDVPVDSETLLVIDFVNLKIKPAHSFRCAHRSMVCVHVFIWVRCLYVYKYMCLYCI